MSKPTPPLTAILAAFACAPPPAAEPAPVTTGYAVPHGVACGDPTDSTLRVWSRTNWHGWLHARIDAANGPIHASRRVQLETDFAGAVTLTGLQPATRYEYRVWFSSSEDATPPETATWGACNTAPRKDANAALRLAWGGDLGGQNVCRDAEEGYAIFDAIDGESLDFFVGLGDMIYADGECSSVGRYGNAQIPGGFPRATRLSDFWAHYRYNREDPGFRRLLAATGYVAAWDDHEVVNDFGPGNDTRSEAPYVAGASLLPIGRQALFDYHPIDAPAPGQIYRSLRWGRHVEVFVTDARQYRDPASMRDTAEAGKSMLGRQQRTWLEASLARTDATWPIILSSVPLSIPSGPGGAAGQDGWAPYHTGTGYYRELEAIWRKAKEAGVTRLVYLTTDVHFATGFRYRPFPGEDFTVYEFTSGPLSAALFPRRDVDETFSAERLYYYAPADPAVVERYDDAKQWMNYGRVEVGPAGALTVRIINANGREVVNVPITPARVRPAHGSPHPTE